ncbi:4-(cytidine 5'-diphospho)-2-C-methyl-D-erythritol kinase [Sphingobium sp. AP49]|uniref:4-(cytidine 5'-diphospho)-2-C-methyl-D-erythritol kinase n=1 Tax=Sphingobium sp. AP49 TaxID=1144307 RepID=UPI001EE63CEB|nr:4-(cytidine 5'-diphospho)-2-C-methyl-D-erythritol kinase [Sphingobium sp. AP49]WHO37146.1 4-(cytidine 5'-diphospho)-2-C-methyl-D-erythritol kinase [Sphingobium sp. AP49]
MIEIAYAKVNLALHVRAKRPDGFHALESLFMFAEDGDVLHARAREDGGLTLVMDGPFGSLLDANDDNLVLRAARSLQMAAGVGRGADILLDKRLPVASGIGGGSADAAATLRLLARLWAIDLAQVDLQAMALSLGSDVPACLASVTQMVRGRGEVLEPQEPVGLAGRPLLLVNPRVGVSTADVFAGWDRIDRGALDASSMEALVQAGRNDLEAPARALAPVIGDILAALRGSQARLARMSGSGATCFALFDTTADMGLAADRLRRDHPGWWTMETRIRTV